MIDETGVWVAIVAASASGCARTGRIWDQLADPRVGARHAQMCPFATASSLEAAANTR
jgi:hypothetical protein